MNVDNLSLIIIVYIQGFTYQTKCWGEILCTIQFIFLQKFDQGDVMMWDRVSWGMVPIHQVVEKWGREKKG